MKVNLIVPDSLNEITLGQYQKWHKLITNNADSEFVRQKTVSIFCNVDMKDVRQMTLSSVDEVYNGLIELFNGSPELISRFTIDKIEFGLIPNFDQMSAGEFADLDDYNSDVEQWHKCMAVLYRPVTKKLSKFYDVEPYKGTEQYAELMKDTPISIVLAVQVFLQFKQRIVERYDGLFGTTTTVGEADYSRESQFFKKWGWYNSFYAIAKGDAFKIDDATELNIHKALTWLSYESEKNQIEIAKLKNNGRGNN